MEITKNPILSGFYPDPSVCSVIKRDEQGEISETDYYLVNSTFSYVPGVPVFHSKDLQNWKQIGHVLERPEQLKLDGAGISEGVYAPTIRWHKGKFYMISTNVSGEGNFYVTADSPQGPWSNPVYLENAEGIDPSLYFEEDRCYYVGQRTKKGAKYFGDCEIWLQELDLQQGKLVGEVFVLWDGSMKHAIWPEGPHIYKNGEYYYLLIAEGGTAYSHSICVARSKEITGPYEGCPNNPIFTHRHLGRNAAIQNVGHGDMVQNSDGEWYIVMLATRPEEGVAPLGRETFLAKVEWEDGWPVINPGIGMLHEGHKETKKEYLIEWSESLDESCMFYGHPVKDRYIVKDSSDGDMMMLRTDGADFGKKQSPTYIGVRVTEKDFSVKTTMRYYSLEKEEAGLVYLYDEKNYVKLIVCRNEQQKSEIRVVLTENGRENLVKRILAVEKGEAKEKEYELELHLSGLLLSCNADGKSVAEVDVRNLTSEVAGGFVGCTMGIYAGSAEEKKKADNYACFSKLLIRS